MAKLTLELFNKEFAIISENKNEIELKNILEIFKQKVEDIEKNYKIDNPLKILVYLSINLLDENINIKKQSILNNLKNSDNEIDENNFSQLINKINRVLEDD